MNYMKYLFCKTIFDNQSLFILMNFDPGWFDKYEGEQRIMLVTLHEWILDHHGIYVKSSYGLPFYYGKSWICYLNPLKKGGVEWAFTRGNELADASGLLESKGRKQVKSISFSKPGEINLATLKHILHEAILLDKTVPYASKRVK